MKKKLLTILSILILASVTCTSYARTTVSSDMAQVIKLYKSGNYSQSYVSADKVIQKDPSNPLAYYYKAMSAAQIGRKGEAISNYDSAISLSSKRSNIKKYAEKGKRCLEEPDKCRDDVFENREDAFVRSKSESGFSDEARSQFERLKIEQMMREMNRSDDINPQKFKEYKDFSSMNTPADMPTNDEIAEAVKTLQRAGLIEFGTNSYSDLSLLSGNNNLLNMMGSENMNPQLIQALFTNSMGLGF